MKQTAITLIALLVLSGVATAAPNTPDGNFGPKLHDEGHFVPVDDALLGAVRGGDRDSCVGFFLGASLAMLAAGAMTANPLVAIGGAYLPAVGALVCN